MTHTETQVDAQVDAENGSLAVTGKAPTGVTSGAVKPDPVTSAPEKRTPGGGPARDGARDAPGAVTADGPVAPDVAVSTAGLPDWLQPVVRAAATVRPEQLSSFLPPEDGAGRQSAVLVLFGEGARGPELLLTERAGSLRSHAGQPSFPGGSLDPEDGDPATVGPLHAALREAREETGLDPSGVQVFGVLPRLYIPISEFVVTPVLGWWHTPSPVGVVDPAETARVFTVPVADLTDPANRATSIHPRGHHGPAFQCGSSLVWGFTAGVIDRILHYAGWELPWDHEKRVPLDWRA
ncbi:NUDIX domain-containing protein [Streptomyces sp. DW26H14]|uniref:NUDIX domain-containing protein n=1 Tax=Streptomyces sp. DW26H14 TaxID=3435395 RepID=UPI00403DA368